MTAGYQVVLDACVLVNSALRDTLLRLAEPPHLYLPRWTYEIMDETRRTLENKLDLSRSQTQHLESEFQKYFGESWVEGYEPLVDSMPNDPKDRHVLAAAVKCGAQTIVTFNVKHFPRELLLPWDVQAQSPDLFLVDQFHLDPETVISKLKQQAAERFGMERLLQTHQETVPQFTQLLQEHLELAQRSSNER